ncbi:MAG: NAD(P)-binding domain-containing protein [Candidatus Methanodesulfokora washburnensis]
MGDERLNIKVCVVGLGEVGLPTAKYILNRSFEVYGYDISPTAIKRAKEEGILKATDIWDEVPPVDVYIVCVSTLLKGDMPDLSPVFDVCEKISKKASSHSLVSIESTIIPGTSRKIYENIFNKNISLIHVPHRYWAGDPVKHGVNQLRVIGGIDQKSLEAGIKFYRDMLGIPLYTCSSIEIAEMCKIAENAYRYVHIAFAEELRMVCEELSLDFNEVREACNTKWNVEIPEAREGIGGHCLPKDIRYLSSLTIHNILLTGAIRADEEYKKWLSEKKQVMIS